MPSDRSSRRTRRLGLALVCAAALLAAAVPGAHAQEFGIKSLTTTVSGAQAGGHPDSTTVVMFDDDGQSPIGRNKDLVVSLPPGFLGNPQAAPECPMADLQADQCAPASQVGVLTLFFMMQGQINPVDLKIHRVPAQPGHAASFAAIALIPTVMLNADIRPGGGYRLTTTLSDASAGIPLAGSQLVFWGVPADPSHDAARGGPAGVPPRPFMIYPSDCSSGDLQVTARASAWEDPGTFVTATSTLPEPTGCEKLSASPSLGVAAEDPRAGAPSGFEIALGVPQSDDPFGLATPPVRKVSVTMPDGVWLSPSASDGLAACTDGQLGAQSDDAAACPAASKLGSVEIDTPLQTLPLRGSIYLGRPAAGDPYRLFLVASGPGTLLKLVGHVTADPATGRLTTTFDDNPPLPFSRLALRFAGGPRAALTVPRTCGTATASAQVTMWSGATAAAAGTFEVTGCSAPRFAPALDAGLTDPIAGSSSAFVLRVQRGDADHEIQALSATLPPGLLAKVAGVPRCADAQAAAGACPAASQVGRVQIGAGPGSNPFSIADGKVFLTEGYRGAPFGLDIAVPAVAGPFDLGLVNVRAALSIDPLTAQVTVTADPFPRILQGIPLQVRDIRVVLDREGFMRAPTSCDELSVGARITSIDGDVAEAANRFQAAACRALGFSPRLAVSLSGRRQTKAGGHPGLTATLTQRAGQANLAKLRLALPAALGVDLGALTVCEPDAAASDRCPAGSAVGRATAVTPLLDHPLTGTVYLVSGARTDPATGAQVATLPTLMVPLKGEMAITLRASSDIVDGRLVTTFQGIPDAPISRFSMTLRGGAGGILRVSATDLCSATRKAGEQIDGHNGKAVDGTVVVRTPCRLRVLSKRAGARSIRLRVTGLGAGVLKVSGRAVRTTRRHIATATVATITARRTGRSRSVTVTFDPSGAAKARSVRVRF